MKTCGKCTHYIPGVPVKSGSCRCELPSFAAGATAVASRVVGADDAYALLCNTYVDHAETCCLPCARQESESGESGDGALKYDDGKPPLQLLPGGSLVDVARVMQHGASKYGATNWTRGMAWTRLVGATLRHVYAWAGGEDTDRESNLPHLAHAVCCLLFLLSYQGHSIGVDDRVILPSGPRKGPACAFWPKDSAGGGTRKIIATADEDAGR